MSRRPADRRAHRRHVGPRLALAVVLPLLAACVAAPARRQPEIGVRMPDDWTAAPAATAMESSERWWEDFGDPRLDDLIQRSLEYNRDLRAAAARVQRAVAEARIAGADLEPSVSAGFDASRRRQNFIGFPIPGSGGRVLSTTSTNLGLSLNVAWEPDLWGRLRAGARASLAELQATTLEYSAARLSIAAQTAKTYFAVVEAQQQLALAEATAASFRRFAEQVRSRYESGVRPSLDLRLALSNQARAESSVEQRRQQLDGLSRQLRVLTGDYPSADPVAAAELPAAPGPVAAWLPAEIVSRRPDLAAAERRLAAVDARLVQSRRALYPRLSLTAGGGTVSDRLEDLLDGDFRVWNLVANLTQPLFQGGRLRAGVDRARALQAESLELYASSVLGALAEVESSLAAERFLAERENGLRRTASQARAAERLALERYRSGLVEYITVLDAQRQALAADSELLAVRRARLDTRADLHLALGGGFEWDPAQLEPPGNPAPGIQEASLR